METDMSNADGKSRQGLTKSEPEFAATSTAIPKNDPAYYQNASSSKSTTSNANQLIPSTGARAGLPPGTSLAAIFRYHMGIEHDEALVPSHLASKAAIDPIATGQNQGRRAVNLGIYNRCIREERQSAHLFWIWSVVINLALGCQIIFAAILTALGAGHGPADVVAVFGTLNTVIAGFLTYLKGTGLPNRMKYFHNQWLKLRAYIEQRERDFASDDHTFMHRIGYTELTEEIEIIEKMYHNIRKDIEKHTPDSYGGGKGESSSDNAPGEGASEASLASKGLHAIRARISGNDDNGGQPKGDIESRVKGAVENVEQRLSGYLSNHLKKLDEHRAQVTYGTTNDMQRRKSNRSNRPDEAIDDMDGDGAEYGVEDIDDMALKRMQQQHERQLEEQDKADRRIKELEEKLAAMEKGRAG